MLNIEQFGARTTPPFKELKAAKVLYDFDGPRIFTVDLDFGILLVYVLHDEKDFQVALLTPTADDIVDSLLNGRITVREALIGGRAWLAEVAYDGFIKNAVSVKFPIADELLPRPGIMLYRSLQPVLSVKLEGAQLYKTNVKASVVRQAIDAGTVSIKRVLDHLWELKPEGRPTNALRLLSDLPAQRFSFGSFEVTFGWPADEPHLVDADALEHDLTQVGGELERLISWAEDQSAKTGEPDLPLLKALERLVPPVSGPVERVIISGGMFKSGTAHVMTRSATKKVRTALKAHEGDQMLISLNGRIGELDKDKLQFTLRDIVAGLPPDFTRNECVCRFSNELYDSVFEHFSEDDIVVVSGRLLKTGKTVGVRVPPFAPTTYRGAGFRRSLVVPRFVPIWEFSDSITEPTPKGANARSIASA